MADLPPSEQCKMRRRQRSESDLVTTLERQDLAGVVRRGDFEAEAFEDHPRLLDLLGVRLGELAGPDPERIFKADADIAAHCGSLSRDPHLVLPRAEHRPVIVVAKQT